LSRRRSGRARRPPERLAPGLVAGGQAQAHVLERGEGAVVDHVGHHRRAEALDAAQAEQHGVAADREALLGLVDVGRQDVDAEVARLAHVRS
jgi:hypothetical protein